MERGLTQHQIISELTRSSHGDFKSYAPIARRALVENPEFFAHLIAWNQRKGSIRDSKTALPLIATESRQDAELLDNALAHLATASPRDLLKALKAARSGKMGHWRTLKRFTERYLRAREANWFWFEKSVLGFRSAMKELYCLANVKASPTAASVLFQGFRPENSTLAVVAALKDMPALEAAGAIASRKIPFLIARGAMGKRMAEPDVLLALIQSMSADTLTTNMKALEKMGVKTNPALRAAVEAGLVKASAKTGFKASKAAEFVSDTTREKLLGVQERQADNMGVDGNWLVLADKSGSMSYSIDIGRHVAATLARVAKGRVTLAFFDTQAGRIDATGKTLDQIKQETSRITASGGTSIGVGLDCALNSNEEYDGIAIVSDGAEHYPPFFTDVYKRYCQKFGKDVPVYLYLMAGEPNRLTAQCSANGIAITEFDLRGKSVDGYSLPNIIQTMRTNKYSLSDEIMATPLLSLSKVLKEKEHDREIEVVQLDEVFA